MSHICKKNPAAAFDTSFEPPSYFQSSCFTAPKSLMSSLYLHAPKPLPQLPRPRGTPPHMPLPIRITLPITQRPSLCRRRYHFDAVLAIFVSFGYVAGVGFVFFESFFEGVGGLAFSF